MANKIMQKRGRKGFTLAETLIVVAIIVILAVVSFIGVLSYMRSLHQLEMDGVAKEIFIAAQNHLSMAESQGYLGRSDYGTEEEGSDGVYYFIVGSGSSADPDDEDSVIGRITRDDFKRYQADGTIAGGMIPKIENALQAVEAGVSRVIITLATAIDGHHGTVIVP